MPVKSIQRGPAAGGAPINFQNRPQANDIYVDGSTNRLVFGAAASGTTAKTLLDSTSSAQALTAPAITSPAITGKPTTYSTVTTYTGATDAIDISLGDIFVLNRAGAVDAATLADPAVGDNGRIIRILNGTTQANTITITSGIGGGGATDDVITFTARPSASITLFAHNTKWYVVGANLAAIA